MDTLEEFDKVNCLLETYGELLTDSQKKIMSQYYEYNLSLGEIADDLQISRTAVLDCIRKSTLKLSQYDDKLHLINTKKALITLLEDYNQSEDKEKIIDEIRSVIKNGI